MKVTTLYEDTSSRRIVAINIRQARVASRREHTNADHPSNSTGDSRVLCSAIARQPGRHRETNRFPRLYRRGNLRIQAALVPRLLELFFIVSTGRVKFSV